MLTHLAHEDFYIICPDNETSSEMDKKRVLWQALDLIENRENAIAKHERYEAESLDQVKNRMERIRNEQTQRLEALANRSKQRNYEDTANSMLQSEQVSKSLYERSLKTLPPATPSAIEITPDSVDDDDAHETVALNNPVIID